MSNNPVSEPTTLAPRDKGLGPEGVDLDDQALVFQPQHLIGLDLVIRGSHYLCRSHPSTFSVRPSPRLGQRHDRR